MECLTLQQIEEMIETVESVAALSQDEKYDKLLITFIRERSRRIQSQEVEQINKKI